ncbi:guanine nucleotide exchange protein for ADP-robosylation factor [Cytospora paraplurivora]|uniref:Guanine nucleotide exchange protein for ADP-robosylation factor n=1 Tax=Cytospora paraplurivora TaxID=2898453 RepID=A0AAN9U8Y6_9PEZI
MSSLKFVASSLAAIQKHAGTRNKPLTESIERAQAALKAADPGLPDPELIFAPLQLASRSGNVQLSTTALDCIGKLVSSSYFSVPSEPPAETSAPGEATAAVPEQRAPPLIERAIDTICDCFQGETTPIEIQLQIVKSLLAAVLNDKIVVHGAGLLKAVRQVYNVFLLSRNTNNQQIAQGTLVQMVGTVFERVKTRLHAKETRLNLAKLRNGESNGTFERQDSMDGSGTNGENDEESTEAADPEPSTSEQPDDEGPKLTLKDLEHRKSFDDSNMGDGPTMVTKLKGNRRAARSVSEQSNAETTATDRDQEDSQESHDAEDEIYVRDAYLVFRSFCNLSTKNLPPDMLISRNGASSVDRVFEVCCDMFWLMLKFMRAPFKKEIEVFLNEIYLALLSRKNASPTQKLHVITILQRFCGDPRALVESYLNYDCDSQMTNIFQTTIEDLAKYSTRDVQVKPEQEQRYEDKAPRSNPGDWQMKGMLPPSLSVAHIVPPDEPEPEIPKEYLLKRGALDSLVESLRSMVNWSQPNPTSGTGESSDVDKRQSLDGVRESIDPSSFADSSSRMDTPPVMPSTPTLEDDPEQLEKEKARKTALARAIRAFNFKPKRGIKMLLDGGFIPSDSPQDIARFLLTDDRLDKAQIGEYLGEGDEKNIQIMHAFVDAMDFTKMRFVDALRRFLQAFRLPGEAQKIDRFMLQYASRYLAGNPNAFASSDTAYVLAYSVIMLNTDLHSSKIARRMTREDFIKNNRGINDNADLPPEYLVAIYDEIASNEIVLKSEREAAAAAGAIPPQATGLAAGLGSVFNVGRDLQREAYVQQSEEIALRSEQLFKDLFRNQRKNAAKAGVRFIPATSFKHVGPMFDVTWMSYFSALSDQMQNAHNIEVIKLCLEGMKLAAKIACFFELSTPREAFISALKNTANLNNPQEVLAKNVEAMKVLLELGQTEGNYLKESWKDILMCISQLDRLQLITGGVDESSVPDVSKARFMPPQRENTSDSRRSTSSRKQHRPRTNTGPQGFSTILALEARSDEIIKSVDKIFTKTADLNGDAIVQFARALTEVSWDEIKVSGAHDRPRMYSLQKIVEISYYNMTRVRFEWTHIWDVLGEHFNKAGCHVNETVVIFSIDSLRQLSMRFMEIDELPGFKFQKDFLKPFEHVMANSNNVRVKELILSCLIQMIQARGENIRSGWRTMFGIFTVAARDPNESIVNMAYENVLKVYKTRFGVVINQGAFTDLIVCLTEFSKNMKYQKKSLQAMETLKSIIPQMLKTPECPLSQRFDIHAAQSSMADINLKSPGQQTRTSVEEGFWFPVLFAFHDVLMTGEDLEVRSNALNYFFEALLKYGGDFPSEFWDILWRQQLYPIFLVLRSRPEMTNALNHEELSVWLSTTMIQALRHMITLFTHYFDALEYMLGRFLELLALCICQENDTIARIGSNCLQQLILQNVRKFTPEHWSRIVGAFCELFERTTAYQLFSATTVNSTASLKSVNKGLDFGAPLSPNLDPTDDNAKSLRLNGAETNVEWDDDRPSTAASTATDEDALKTPTATTPLEEFKPSANLQMPPPQISAARRRFFNRIISRCVLQLLMIETVSELFSNDNVYSQIPSNELLRLMAVLKKSFLFAQRFNNDKELRMRLWREGFMKQPPNLLKQESGSAATYVAILFRMFSDTDPRRSESKADVENALVPLCKSIIRSYISLEEESQHRNIVAWRPVVVDVLEGYAAFPEENFSAHVQAFYQLVLDLIASKEMTGDLRSATLGVLKRVGEVELGMKSVAQNGDDPRRNSVVSIRSDATSNIVDREGGDASSRMLGR